MFISSLKFKVNSLKYIDPSISDIKELTAEPSNMLDICGVVVLISLRLGDISLI